MVFDRGIGFLILFPALGILAWEDWKYRRISNKILAFLILFGAFGILERLGMSWEEGLALLKAGGTGFLLGGGLAFALYLLTGGIGAGDVKLIGVLGLWLGAEGLGKAVFVAALLVSCRCGLWMAFGGLDRKEKIPLAPFLWLGAAGAMVWGG